MKAYPKYKNSGIEWIGEIPDGWQIVKLSQMGCFTASGIDKKTIETEPLVKMINYTDIYGNISNKLTRSRQYMIVSCSNGKKIKHQVRRGDLIFTPSSETIVDIGLSAVVDDELLETVYSYHVLRFQFLTRTEHGYKKYLCNNDFVLNQFSKKAKGTTRQILVRDDFNTIKVVVPPLPEQTQISNYLDHKTNLIDTLIDKKQKQIELLKEQRTAIINQAVTKGLDPNVKMKNSGIEWLGEIPESWRKSCIRYEIMSKNLSHQDGNHGELHPIADDYVHDGIPFIMANNVTHGKLNLLDCKYIPKDLSDNLRIGFSINGDVLLTHKGTVGRVALVDNIKTDYIMLTPQVTYYRCINKIYNKFLRYTFEAHYFQTQLEIIASKGSTRNYIGLIAQKDLFILFPPIGEQQLIVKEIEKKLSPVNQTIKGDSQQIDQLKEYRTTLISEAVTGKIDVRDEVVQ